MPAPSPSSGSAPTAPRWSSDGFWGSVTVSLAVFPGVGGLLVELGGWRLPFALFPLALVTAVLISRRLGEVDLGPPVPWRRQVAAISRLGRKRGSE